VAHHFQVNLRGIIDLLSNHLYSGPEVFVRELLQNAVDAIRAREKVEPGYGGAIVLELAKPRSGPPTLVVSDDGVGLTEEEIHKFLAVIGESSKRGALGERPPDFIGQFGIGLLSCFMVSEEIVVVTRSAKAGAATMEWRGRADGSYAVKTLDADIAPGAHVHLTCKEGSEEYFDRERLTELVQHFGGLLPYPIRLTSGKTSKPLNGDPPPWRKNSASTKAGRKALLAFGKERFGETFFDAIPVDLKRERIDGVAYVLSASPSPTAKQEHRVYLKNMFLSERADNLLPPWAFFVKLIVNVADLKPTASREGFKEDAALRRAREALGDRLRGYLIELSENEPDRLLKLIDLHDLTVKALAVADDEFYKIVFPWLPVETSEGDMTLGEYRARHDVFRYAATQDQFRQIAQVAAAQNVCVINACYTYMQELLEKYATAFDDGRAEKIEAWDVVETFGDLDEAEERRGEAFLRRADAVLRPFRCYAAMKKFAPADLPALYTTSAEGQFLRSVEQAKDVADPHWSSLLDRVAPKAAGGASFSQLCFNFDNPMTQRLLRVANDDVLRRSVQTLYVQSLLLGHHPLHAKELKLLNEGLSGLIELALAADEGA
jgi:molecular chaperone HtpG